MAVLVRVLTALTSRLGPMPALTGRTATVAGRAGKWVGLASIPGVFGTALRRVLANPVIRRALTAGGVLTALEIFIPDLVNPTAIVGGGGDQTHPGQVVKSWTANGTPFVRLADGKMGARKKDGVWKYWRPKKPIVLFAGGSSNLNTLLKADRAADKQLKRLEKAIRRRNPVRRQRRSPGTAMVPTGQPQVVVETGPGSVNT